MKVVYQKVENPDQEAINRAFEIVFEKALEIYNKNKNINEN